jgi:hypothetical protein
MGMGRGVGWIGRGEGREEGERREGKGEGKDVGREEETGEGGGERRRSGKQSEMSGISTDTVESKKIFLQVCFACAMRIQHAQINKNKNKLLERCGGSQTPNPKNQPPNNHHPPQSSTHPPIHPHPSTPISTHPPIHTHSPNPIKRINEKYRSSGVHRTTAVRRRPAPAARVRSPRCAENASERARQSEREREKKKSKNQKNNNNNNDRPPKKWKLSKTICTKTSDQPMLLHKN